MNPIEMKEIEYVLAVYQEKSFSKAARKCYVTQPALSRSIRKVELNLGFTLFDRNATPLRLTSDGEKAFAILQKIYDTHKELEIYCDAVQNRSFQELVIGAPSSYCTYILPAVIAGFRYSHPEWNIRAMELNPNDLERLLRDKVLQMGICIERDSMSDLPHTLLQTDEIILAVPRSMPENEVLAEYQIPPELLNEGESDLSAYPAVSLREFHHEPFLTLKEGNDMHDRSNRYFQSAGFTPRIAMELDQLISAYYLSVSGIGISFIRASLPYYIGVNENLCFYKIDHADTFRNVMIYSTADVSQEAIASHFIKALRDNCN